MDPIQPGEWLPLAALAVSLFALGFQVWVWWKTRHW